MKKVFTRGFTHWPLIEFSYYFPIKLVDATIVAKGQKSPSFQGLKIKRFGFNDLLHSI